VDKRFKIEGQLGGRHFILAAPPHAPPPVVTPLLLILCVFTEYFGRLWRTPAILFTDPLGSADHSLKSPDLLVHNSSVTIYLFVFNCALTQKGHFATFSGKLIKSYQLNTITFIQKLLYSFTSFKKFSSVAAKSTTFYDLSNCIC